MRKKEKVVKKTKKQLSLTRVATNFLKRYRKKPEKQYEFYNSDKTFKTIINMFDYDDYYKFSLKSYITDKYIKNYKSKISNKYIKDDTIRISMDIYKNNNNKKPKFKTLRILSKKQDEIYEGEIKGYLAGFYKNINTEDLPESEQKIWKGFAYFQLCNLLNILKREKYISNNDNIYLTASGELLKKGKVVSMKGLINHYKSMGFIPIFKNQELDIEPGVKLISNVENLVKNCIKKFKINF